MLILLKYLDARLGEPGTWASISAMLVLAHVSVDPGLWHTITAWGIIGAGLLGVVLREIGNKPPMQIASDVLQMLLAGIKAMTPDNPPPASAGSVGPSVPVHVVGNEPAPSPSSQESVLKSLIPFFAASCAMLLLAACSQPQLVAAASTPAGQLFCQFQTSGGGAAIVAVTDAEASAVAGAAAPIAILATGATKTQVDNICAQAAVNEGGTAGVPVSPPTTTVGSVAVNPSTLPTTSTSS